ncbi:hypothetical protein ACQR3P_29085 [Rhodococcus sp. IEGM1300]
MEKEQLIEAVKLNYDCLLDGEYRVYTSAWDLFKTEYLAGSDSEQLIQYIYCFAVDDMVFDETFFNDDENVFIIDDKTYVFCKDWTRD